MPANRSALIRYKTINACLRNRLKKWTLEMLIDAVSDALYELEGIDKGISARTIQADIQMMRSDKLGYNAPIVVVNKKYYMYEDPEYSITGIPITEDDLTRMNEAVEMLRQFKGFSHFSDLNEVVQRLEDHVYATSHQTQPVIDFEKNEQLKGLGLLEPIYQAIISRQPLQIEYLSFKARHANTFIFHAWWLKEFKRAIRS
jgi:predicted DNA-binding transcriptional regulator YafY